MRIARNLRIVTTIVFPSDVQTLEMPDAIELKRAVARSATDIFTAWSRAGA